MLIHYINLTNGIQAINDFKLVDYRFIRIQSTTCEQKRFAELIMTISDDFLLNAVLGNKLIVYDYGAGKEIPRAIWQGLEWIKFCLFRRWLNEVYVPEYPRSQRCLNYFHEQYAILGNRERTRLDYFKKFYMNKGINITSIQSSTQKDGDYLYYKTSISTHNIRK
jgi:hypothetical protein